MTQKIRGVKNSTRGSAFQRFMESSVEKVVRSEAANRHAYYALKTGRVAEALVVLEAAAEGIHLSWSGLEVLVAAKEAELLRDAELADDKSILAAWERHQREVGLSNPKAAEAAEQDM